MLGRLGRTWQSWVDKAKLLAPLWTPRRGQFAAYELHFPELRDVLAAGGPELEP